MNIKNKPLLTLVVKRNKTPLNAVHNPDKGDEHEDAELGLLVEERKEQEEIEVDINLL